MKNILITGGAGFIGCNAAARYIKKGARVTVLDNLSRRGSEVNLEWLRGLGPFQFVRADIREPAALRRAFKDGSFDLVLHFAAQVAVTDSVHNPRDDFERNALGTFNLLEAVRQSGQNPVFIFSSTNKVYGSLEDVALRETKTRYSFFGKREAISEIYGLDFHSPYGCSKGAADQYVRDYSRIYGLRTVVFRQSCIYGERQFGVEDQGWVAWFIIAHQLGRSLTLYGDGKQVRDILYIGDLLDAVDRAISRIGKSQGRVYNIGGGPKNSISLLEFLALLGKVSGRKAKFSFAGARPGDQKIYVSDIAFARKELGWQPKVGVGEGVRRLYKWVSENISQIQKVVGH
jgi:CDP-paratose 2-epimerase